MIYTSLFILLVSACSYKSDSKKSCASYKPVLCMGSGSTQRHCYVDNSGCEVCECLDQQGYRNYQMKNFTN